MRKLTQRLLLLAFAAALIPACGGGGGGGGGAAGTVLPRMYIAGGNATGPLNDSFGGEAGTFVVNSQGAVTFGVQTARTRSTTPAAPAPALEITDLSANVNLPASGQITGTVTASGAGSRTIIVGGDLHISGTLLTGNFGGDPIQLSLLAPTGTIYISGLIRSTQDGTPNGDNGGHITLSAMKIVVTGRLELRGEAGTTSGGTGGSLDMNTVSFAGTDILLHGATIDLRGGDGTTAGGDAGSLTLNAQNNAELYGSFQVPGGSAAGTTDSVLGGNAGGIVVNAVGAVWTDMTLTANGGTAVTTGSGAKGGQGGGFQIQAFNSVSTGEASLFGSWNLAGGDASSPAGPNDTVGGLGGSLSVGVSTVFGPSIVNFPTAEIALNGGSSTGYAGGGSQSFDVSSAAGGIVFNGTASLDAGAGPLGGTSSDAGLNWIALMNDLVINGSISGNAADGSGIPRGGAQCLFTAANGNLLIDATLSSNGGNATGAATVKGGDADDQGLNFQFNVLSVGRNVVLSPNTRITANGGAGAGNGAGGHGGRVEFNTNTNILLGCVTVMNGGNGAGTGAGGNGGRFTVRSDLDNNGLGGSITLQAGASLTLNGGAGASGGSGENPAVSFDADGNDSDSLLNTGIVMNNGSITTRGFGTGSNGGGVIFDGIQAGGGAIQPLAGVQNRAGNGGAAGVFTSQ